MGKRGRQQIVDALSVVRPAWQTARVRVDDETWSEFRRLLGDRSVAEALGAHVEAEVAAWRRRQASRPELGEREVLAALTRIEDAKATLEALTLRLERRLPVRRLGEDPGRR